VPAGGWIAHQNVMAIGGDVRTDEVNGSLRRLSLAGVRR
jgi:hypothetical protein